MFAFPSRPVFAVARSSRLGVVFATLCAVFLVAAFAAAPAAVAQDDDLFGDLSPDATLADADSAPAAPAPAADAAAPAETPVKEEKKKNALEKAFDRLKFW